MFMLCVNKNNTLL